MQDAEAVLLLDDCELDSVRQLLDRSGVSFRRLRGAEIGDDLEPPRSLLIATPRHAQKVRRGSPKGASADRPIRIIAVDEDSPSLRRILRDMGFSILVRLPAHDEVWRLLVQRALYQGDERRRETRLPVGAQISVTQHGFGSGNVSSGRTAVLADISNRGCHVVADEPFRVGARICFALSSAATGSEPLELSGEIVRTGPWNESDTSARFSAAVAFDADTSDNQRMTLARMINSKISGPQSLAPQGEGDLALPSCDSPVLPGLLLDDETDPAVATQLEVELATADIFDTTFDPDEQRKNRRVDYQQRIEAESSNDQTILIGRDLSAGGMRVERFADAEIGAHLELALYGLTDSTPLQVDAEIVRDDGERGIALRFSNLTRKAADELERFITCLPAVESLEDGEESGMGSVLTQIIGAGDASRNR